MIRVKLLVNYRVYDRPILLRKLLKRALVFVPLFIDLDSRSMLMIRRLSERALQFIIYLPAYFSAHIYFSKSKKRLPLLREVVFAGVKIEL